MAPLAHGSRGLLGIGTKAALTFWAFAVFCVGVTSVALLSKSRASFESAVSDRQLLLTKNRAIALRDNLDLATTELLKLARTMEAELHDSDPLPEQWLLGASWQQSAFFNRSLQLIRADGTCVWAEPDTVPCETSRDAPAGWLEGVVNSGEPAFVYVSEPDGTGMATLVVPVGGPDGEPFGVLSGTVDLEQDRMLSPALVDDLPPSTRAVLVSDTGVVIHVTPGTPLDDPALRQAMDAVQQSEYGARLTGGKERELVAWAPVEYGSLGLVFSWPWAALDDTSYVQTRHLLWLVGLITLVALALGYGAAQALVRPVVRLVSQVQGARSDPSKLPPRTRRRDEIGALQRSFRRLLQTLNLRNRRIQSDMRKITDLASTLEQRVAERTAELERAQAALLEAERLAVIGQAGALISHELRNSLNTINVGLDLVAREAVRAKPGLKTIQQQIRAEVSRLRTLSDELLTFAKDPKIEPRPVAAEDLLSSAAALVEEHRATLGVELGIEAAPGMGRLLLDSDRIQSVLVNLLRNGIDAAAVSANVPRRVQASACLDPQGLLIRVEDSGDGLTDEVASRLFQPFVTTKRTGVGLGLATAERFVRAHGGSLSLARGNLAGACFEVRLPALTVREKCA